MQRTSGRIRCSNCGGDSAVWRLRFATDEKGEAHIYAYCDVCRCMIDFKLAARWFRELKRDGALIYD